MSRTYFGDWLATFFRWFGFRPKPGCGCDKRKQALNELHQKAERVLLRRGAR